MKWKEGYKVLRSGRFSVFSLGDERGVRLYLEGNKVTPAPGCGPLCVFRSRVDAETFRRTYHRIAAQTVHCKYLEAEDKIVWDRKRSRKLSDLPEGTVLASAVVCTE